MAKLILWATLTFLQGGPELEWYGGDWLMLRIAHASEQRWILLGTPDKPTLAVAAIVDGRLVVYAVDLQLAFRDVPPGPFPGPQPDPNPNPGPSPGPQPVGPFTAAIVEESAERDTLPREVVKAITSQSIRQYVAEKKSQFFLVDKDAETENRTLQEMIQEAVKHPLPRLIVRDSQGRIVVNEAVASESGVLDAIQRVIK